MEKETLIIKKLNEHFHGVAGRSVRLLDKIDLTARENDIIGLVGETGAGKSILLDAIGCNPRPPLIVVAEQQTLLTNGKAEELQRKDNSELRRIWGRQIAFIPPNARDQLNPITKVGEQVRKIVKESLEISNEDARRKVIEIFRLVQMPDPERNYENYPHELSGGMAQRVVISAALSVSPRLLLADEPTMGLDVTIQTQVLDLMVKLLSEMKSSVILATRDLGIVANYCNKIAVLCNGQIVEFCEVRDFFKDPIHPYSQYLLAAAFSSFGKKVDFDAVLKKSEKVERYRNIGCRFVSRCPRSIRNCFEKDLPDNKITDSHLVRCHVEKGV